MESTQLSSKISDLDLTDILTTYDDGSRSAVMPNALISAAARNDDTSTKKIGSSPTICPNFAGKRT